MLIQLTDKQLRLFWNHVDIKDECDCWLWNGYKDQDGYGRVTIRGKGDVHSHCWGAHRVSWMLHFGEIPDGMFVLHGPCNNTSCVNPKFPDLEIYLKEN
jgi:hypothetical protein